MSWSKRMSEMGPMRVRSRRRCRISSWPAAKGMRASSAVPMQIEAPSGTKRATASRMDMSLGRGTRVSCSTRRGGLESPERGLLAGGQRVAVDVQDHRHDGVVPGDRDQVDDALVAEAVGDRLEGGVGDRPVPEELGAEVVHDA